MSAKYHVPVPVLYFDDFETYKEESWYYKKYNDVVPYLCCSYQVILEYDYKQSHYSKGYLGIKQHFTRVNLLENYFKFYTSTYNIRKYKLGYNQIHYFHNGRKFDFEFILCYLRQREDVKFINAIKEISRPENAEYKYFCLTKGSDAYRSILFVNKLSDRTIKMELRDSLYIFDSSVEELGKRVGYPKGDFEDSNEEENKRDIVTDKCLEYCYRDCEIVARTFLNYIPFLPKGSKIPQTIGSGARQVFLSQLPEDKTTKNKFKVFQKLVGIDNEEQARINQYFLQNHLYKGGLTTFNENYRIKRITAKIFLDDVKSQYPFQMVQDMPFGKMKKIKASEIDKYNIVFIRKHYTNLKQISKRFPNYIQITNALQQYQSEAPEYELFECKEYIKYFEKIHTFDSVETLEIIAFDSVPSYFKSYIFYGYQTKKDSEEDTPPYIQAKLMLNCLYGKTAQQELMEMEIFKGTDPGDYKIIDSEYRATQLDFVHVLALTPQPFYYLHIASYITSKGRAYLLKRAYYLGSKGAVVLYHDTDSVIYMFPDNDNSQIQYSHKLGGGELKHTYNYYFCLGAKKYLIFEKLGKNFEDIGEYKMSSAGVSKKFIKKFPINQFVNNGAFPFLQAVHTKSGLFLRETVKYLIKPEVYNYVRNYNL